jgi:hypothetical protein
MWKRLIVLVAVISLPLIPIAVVVRHSSSGTSGVVERAAQLPVLTGAQLRALSGGEAVLIEGTIDVQSRMPDQPFVAYQRQISMVDNDLGRYWYAAGQVTPPLWIVLSDGERVHVVNSAYQLRHVYSTWAAIPPSLNDGSTRYIGLQVGDRVTVMGTFVTERGSLALRAVVVAGGSRAEWLADERVIGPSTLDGVIFAGVAISVVALGLWRLAPHSSNRASPAGV